MVPLIRAGRLLHSWWWRTWIALALANLILGFVIYRDIDLVTMHRWTSAWLFQGLDLFAQAEWGVDYPPNGIVVLSPMALLTPHQAGFVWAGLSLALAALAPGLAARCVRDDAPAADVAVLTVTFLCWSGVRTVLQFTLLPLVLALLAWRLADKRPWLAGAALGLAVMKPQVALPICLWVLLRGRWRVLAAAAATAAGLLAVYCLRVEGSPVDVLQGWLRAIAVVYTGPDRMTGFSELSALMTSDAADTWAPVLAAVLYAGVLAGALGEQQRATATGRPARFLALPGIAAAATLLAFRHMSLAFVSLLPAAAYLLLDGDTTTRDRRGPLFWLLQAFMIVDLPTIQRRLGFLGVSLGPVDVVFRHADRLAIAGLFVALVALQWMAIDARSGAPVQGAGDAA
ncbi:MAG: glycosyltransferase family 87 protein [Vicinamibacterales bacterium]